MSASTRSRTAASQRHRATVFAALGHETRLQLVSRLAAGEVCSITELCQRTRLSRQAITKHLHVLERAGVVRSVRSGREKRFAYQPGRLVEIGDYLQSISAQWDAALARLQAFVETEP
jgi:DNA-binding transcriptional ArsR family regulator